MRIQHQFTIRVATPINSSRCSILKKQLRLRETQLQVSRRIVVKQKLDFFSHLQRCQLVGSRTEQKVDEIAFVRLQPVESACRDGTDVQSVDVSCVGQLVNPNFIARERGSNEGRADRLDHLFLRTFHYRNKRKHVFLHGNSTRR